MKPQKITTTNYFDTINKIGFENLPSVLQQSHKLIMDNTNSGKDWDVYKNDVDLKRMIDLVFKKLEEFMQSKSSKSKSVNGLEGTKFLNWSNLTSNVF
jgi:hypothetical protein